MVTCPYCGQITSGNYCQWCNYPLRRRGLIRRWRDSEAMRTARETKMSALADAARKVAEIKAARRTAGTTRRTYDSEITEIPPAEAEVPGITARANTGNFESRITKAVAEAEAAKISAESARIAAEVEAARRVAEAIRGAYEAREARRIAEAEAARISTEAARIVVKALAARTAAEAEAAEKAAEAERLAKIAAEAEEARKAAEARLARITKGIEIVKRGSGAEQTVKAAEDRSVLTSGEVGEFTKEQDRIKPEITARGEEAAGEIAAGGYTEIVEPILSLDVTPHQFKSIEKYLDMIERITDELKTLKIGTEEAIKRLRRISEEVSL